MGHSIKREIVRCLLSGNMSFSELINAIAVKNHGDFGYHLRSLKGFIELDPLTKKYRLTYRGSLLAACIENFRFITSSSEKLTTYVRNLRFGDHAAAFYRTEDFKRSICTPYLKEGLSRGEAAIYVVSEHRVNSEMREIQRRITDFSSLPKGHLKLCKLMSGMWKKEKLKLKRLWPIGRNSSKRSKKLGSKEYVQLAKRKFSLIMQKLSNYSNMRELWANISLWIYAGYASTTQKGSMKNNFLKFTTVMVTQSLRTYLEKR